MNKPSLGDILKQDHDFIANMVGHFPSDIHHNELMTLAVEAMVADCEKVKRLIWQKRASEINIDLLEDGTLSSGERLITQAAISIWTYGVASVELWQILNKLDYKNSRNFIRAVSIVHYSDAVKRAADDIANDRMIERLRSQMMNDD
jgi:hypothetical protein